MLIDKPLYCFLQQVKIITLTLGEYKMGLFDFYKQSDINHGVLEYQNTQGAVLLDVRTPQEYAEGHIPGSINIPLQSIDEAEAELENKDTELFVYCHSGARSSQAVALLEEMGYTKVNNIGGIAGYKGEVER